MAAARLERTLNGDDTSGVLAEEACTKLLLYGIPRTVPAVVELERHLALWEDQDHEAMLTNIHLQAGARNRALQQTAVTSSNTALEGSVGPARRHSAINTRTQQQTWSGQTAEHFRPAAAVMNLAYPEIHLLKVIDCPPKKASEPSLSRPEQGMQSVRRRCVANSSCEPLVVQLILASAESCRLWRGGF